MLASVEALLRSVVDYAGTFPPAKLELTNALSNYARARAGKDAWMLGRCVLPVAALRELEFKEAEEHDDQSRGAWPLSVIMTGDPSEIDLVQRFNTQWSGRAAVAALEFAPPALAKIDLLAPRIPRGLDRFFEIPPDADFESRVKAVAGHGALVKIRTGGIVEGAFPDAAGLVRAMRSCADVSVAVKASAGLHHAICGRYALTYDADSPRAPMYGFLNMCVTATLVHLRAPSVEAATALQESSAPAFRFTQDALTWRDRTIGVADLTEARRSFFRSFGSCAFEEPVEDLERLGLL